MSIIVAGSIKDPVPHKRLFRVRNGDSETEVSIWFKVNLDSDEQYHRIKEEVTGLFASAFESVAVPYKGYPSAMHKTEKVTIYIDEIRRMGRNTATVEPMDNEAKGIRIEVRYDLLDRPNIVKAALVHELLHIVSQIHEQENHLTNELRVVLTKDLKNLEFAEERNLALSQRCVEYSKSLERVLKTNPLSEQISAEHFKKLAEVESVDFLEFLRKFYNWIADIALDLIAIRIKQWGMVEEYNKFTMEQVRKLNFLQSDGVIKEIVSYIEKDGKIDKNEKHKLLNMFYLLEWMLFISAFPVHVLAYIVARTEEKNPNLMELYNYSGSSLWNYKHAVEKATPMNKPKLERFISLMISIAEAQRIGGEAIENKLQKVIHHQGSINLAKEAINYVYGVYEEYAKNI
jgi:hypothetical protein